MTITRIHNKQTEYTHKILWSCCVRQKEIADSKEVTRPHFRLTTMLMAYFAFEGYINFLGALLCPEQWEDEKAFFNSKDYHGIKGKMKLLAETLGLPPLHEFKEFHTIMSLKELRSYVVHAKTAQYEEVLEHRGEGLPPPKLSPFEKMVQRERMERAVSDVMSFAGVFHECARGQSDDPVFNWPPFDGSLGHGSGDVETIPEPSPGAYSSKAADGLPGNAQE
jgi:hypothetical protein